MDFFFKVFVTCHSQEMDLTKNWFLSSCFFFFFWKKKIQHLYTHRLNDDDMDTKLLYFTAGKKEKIFTVL